MRFLELDVRAGSVFTLIGILTLVDAFGEFELILDYYPARADEEYLHIKYSMNDYRKEGACGRLVFSAEDWRLMSNRRTNRYINLYACLLAPSWNNEVPTKIAGQVDKVEVESMVLTPTLELSYYAGKGSVVLESGTSGFLL
jgi:hypothetical protein